VGGKVVRVQLHDKSGPLWELVLKVVLERLVDELDRKGGTINLPDLAVKLENQGLPYQPMLSALKKRDWRLNENQTMTKAGAEA
jgi:hypothetical protein